MAACNRWKAIWDRKGREAREAGATNLIDLIRADGFDSGAGGCCLESWGKLTSSAHRKLMLAPGMKVFEVGCGSGAFLYPAHQAGIDVAGLDLSESMIEVASQAMPNGSFSCGEACRLHPENGTYDAVLSHSVFQYFDSAAYAEKCLKEMIRILKPGGCLAVLDVNDAAKKADFQRIREAKIGAEAYAAMYRDAPHRFYHKSWFVELLESRGFVVEIHDLAVQSYANSAFRYNVFARPASLDVSH